MSALRKTPPPSVDQDQPGIVRSYAFMEGDGQFRHEVLAGLAASRKSLPFHWRHDHEGLLAAEAWAGAPENHLLAGEAALLQAHLPEAAVIMGAGLELIEMGPGCGLQTPLVLEHLDAPLYLPLGRDPAGLAAAIGRVAERRPGQHIAALYADPLQPLILPRFAGVALRKRALFLSALALATWTVDDLALLLRQARRLLGSGGAVLATLDLKKNRKWLDGAVNDAQGLAARWNASLLGRINRELEGDFQAERFRHVGMHNEKLGCTGLYLESAYAQFVHVAGQRIDFAEGEVMLTGLLTQHSEQDFTVMAAEAGFKLQKFWSDEQRRVGLALLMAV